MKQQPAKEQIKKILEEYGGKTADKTTNILLEDQTLKELKPELEFISKNWRDPLRPAMVKIACEAFEGKSQSTEEVGIAMSLMNLSFYLWDDMVDEATHRLFNPTFFGRFGAGPTLIMGGIASAKAFTILSKAKMDEEKRKAIATLFWDMWAKMSTTEAVNLRVRENHYSSKDKLLKISAEAEADLGNCLRMGAVIGNGLKNEIEHLGKYGLYLGIILELQHDFQVSANLTLELAEKVKIGSLPYTLLLAKESSVDLQETLNDISLKESIETEEIDRIVQAFLAADMLTKIEDTIEKLSKKAIEEIAVINKKGAAKALRSFAEVQPRSFKESLQQL
jgi:geranylgeranyl pyrophosphate synthase